MDQRYLSLQERARRGNLPLKKRRLVDVDRTLPFQFGLGQRAAFNASSSGSTAASGSGRLDLARLPEFPMNLAAVGATPYSLSDEKIAALALVAAAASSSQRAAPPAAAAGTVPYHGKAPIRVSLGAASSGMPPELSYSSIMEAEAASSEAEEYDSDSDGTEYSDVTEKRAHRDFVGASNTTSGPPDGGCHGRTSRSHAFCKKLPCYNGSNYCKLHYQQYVMGSGKPNPSSADVARVTPSKARKVVSAPVAASSSSLQDRRYSGSAGEVRCSATTTRGRACANVAANGTCYCHLHASYDPNPPARRRSKSSAHAVESDSPGIRRSDSLSSSGPPAEVSVASPPSVMSEESTRLPSPMPAEKSQNKAAQKRVRRGGSGGNSTGNSGRRSNSKLAEKHADSPYPLLSMISSDQWFDKTVTIACGPMAGRVGQVVKWGNGWVSVRIPGMGMHNRRSFELYLHVDDEDGEHQSSLGRKASLEDNQDPSLLRCVSREAVSPSPLSDNGAGNKTPNISSSAQIGCSTFDSEEATPRDFKSSIPAHVVETPQPEKVTEAKGDEPATDSLPSLRSPIPSQVAPIPEQISNMVTPVAPKISLDIAQDGGSNKYNIDMLFGSAALDRSRKTVSQPTRYEDMAIVSKTTHGDSVEGTTGREINGS